jgi:5'-3' exonuclease
MKIALFDGSNFSHISFHRAKSIIFKNKIKIYAQENGISEREAKKVVAIDSSDYDGIEALTYTVFFRKIHKYFKIFNDYKWVIAWDNPTSSDWRREVYTDYKGNRDYDTDPIWREVMFPCMDKLKECLNHYPVIQITIEKLEADDIAYLVAKHFKGKDTVLLSTDSDWIQIVQEFGVKLFHPLTDKYKQAPKDYEYIIQKAIMGDKGDNIPGLEGYGPKKSQKLAEDLYGEDFIDDLSGPELTAEQQETILRNVKLMSIASNPYIKTANIDYSMFNSQPKIDLKKIQKFYFDNKLKALLEGFDKVADILS